MNNAHKPPSRKDQKKANRAEILQNAKRPLAEEELARLEHKQPAIMPAKLARPRPSHPVARV